MPPFNIDGPVALAIKTIYTVSFKLVNPKFLCFICCLMKKASQVQLSYLVFVWHCLLDGVWKWINYCSPLWTCCWLTYLRV